MKHDHRAVRSAHARILRACMSLAVFGPGLAVSAQAVESPPPIKDLLLPLCVNGECGIVNEQGEILLPFSKNNLLGPADFKSLYIFVEKEKYGLKDRSGAVLIGPGYDNMAYLGDGLLAVMKGNRWGIVNPQGKVLVPLVYDDQWYHATAGVIQMQKGERYFAFDKTGKMFDGAESKSFIETYERPEQVKAGFAKWLKIESPNASGATLYNTQTRQKTQPYAQVFHVSNGYLLVANEKSQRTLLDSDGKALFPFKYDHSLSHPRDGWIPFGENSLYGFLDMKGAVVIPAKYKYVGNVGKMGAVVGVEDAKSSLGYAFGVIDRKGGWAIEPAYAEGGGMDQGKPLVSLSKGGKVGVLDLDTLKWVVPVAHAYASADGSFIAAGALPPGLEGGQNPFGEPGKSKARQDGSGKTMALLNSDGSVLIPAKYRMFNSPTFFGTDGYTFAWKVQGENQAVIDPNGKEIIGMDWEDYKFMKPGLIIGGSKLASGEQTWEAYYDQGGKLLLVYKTDPCGQQQIVTGDQRVVWPQKLPKACNKRARAAVAK